MEYLKIAENFGKTVYLYKDKLKIADLMLFGSVAYGKKNPTDLDILVLHYSEKFENFQDIAETKTKTNNLEKLTKLAEFFNGEIDILKIMQETPIMQLVSLNKFNTKYMDIKFFTDELYRNNWNRQNIDANFAKNIFGQGFLWNPQNKKYDIPALQKYNLKKLQNFKINSYSNFIGCNFSSLFNL